MLPYLGLQDFPLVLLFVLDAQGEPNTLLAAPGFVTPSLSPASQPDARTAASFPVLARTTSEA
jgi:hypothetical protein